MNRRERFEYQNRHYINGYEANPILVLPDSNLKTLDMFPRVDLIEDLQFRKALPNSFKMHKFSIPFSDQACYSKNRINFTNQMAKDQLKVGKMRDVRRGVRKESPSPETKKPAHMMTEEEKNAQKEPELWNRKPHLLNVRNSKALLVPKSNVNQASKSKIFGNKEAAIPWGTPSIHLLQFLSEQELFDVNKKITMLYQKELARENME